MSKLPKQTKRRVLIKRMRALGFAGPYQAAKGSGVGDHPEFMSKDDRVVSLPNPHRADIGEGLLKKILAEANLSADQWLGIQPTEGSDPD